jgi:hypothetical protein
MAGDAGGGGMTWPMGELPDTAGLLDIARRTLLDDIAPTLEGDLRFKALMVANAMAIAGRARLAGEVAEAALALGDGATLSAAIRAGAHDPGTPDHARIEAALFALAEAKCRISAPRALRG